MALVEAVVPFAPAPHLLSSELRELVEPVERGVHGRTWQARPGVAADPAARARWTQARRRFEHVYAIGERWQLHEVLEAAAADGRLVHLHDLAADLAEGAQAAGTVLADVPSAVAGEATEMVAGLAELLETHPGSGCRVVGPDGTTAWAGAALHGRVAVRGRSPDRLVLDTDGTLWLGPDGQLQGWQVSPEGVRAQVSGTQGTHDAVVDETQAAWLRELAPTGATAVQACPVLEAVAPVVSGLADGLAASARFQRSLLLETAR